MLTADHRKLLAGKSSADCPTLKSTTDHMPKACLLTPKFSAPPPSANASAGQGRRLQQGTKVVVIYQVGSSSCMFQHEDAQQRRPAGYPVLAGLVREMRQGTASSVLGYPLCSLGLPVTVLCCMLLLESCSSAMGMVYYGALIRFVICTMIATH